MDYEDDMHDTDSTIDSLHDLYSSTDEEDYDEEEFIENNVDVNWDDNTKSKGEENYYSVLSETDIRQRQEEDITRLSTVLYISKSSSSILLRHYDWSVNNVHDAWFADEEKVRKTVGLLVEKPTIFIQHTREEEMTCGICFETYSYNGMKTADCGHPFCTSCWTGYIAASIDDGLGCLMLRCPQPLCRAALDQDMIDSLVSDDQKKKYSHYLITSYVESNRKIKWCPAPDCNFAIDFVVGSASYDVSCKCEYKFCWNCTEEAHRPVDCGTVGKWILRSSSESENWILANSKRCPKCERPIQKSHGCMHMTCSQCGSEFCWLCLGKWKDHGSFTGGFYGCNRYENKKRKGKYDEAEKKREMAKNALQRYNHYYDRWVNNESSKQKAIDDLHHMQAVGLGKLSDKQGTPETLLKFVLDAWLQIIQCRRMLKWTYAYGYYIPEEEQAKKQFFEYLQGEAESGLERLHHCAEKEIQKFLNADIPSHDFNEFHTKLVDLTCVTGNFFVNLVQALENDLSDVESHGCTRRLDSKVEDSGNKGTTSISSGGSGGGGGISHWSCQHCSSVNPKSTNKCHRCGLKNLTWYCKHCAFANAKATETCQMCHQCR